MSFQSIPWFIQPITSPSSGRPSPGFRLEEVLRESGKASVDAHIFQNAEPEAFTSGGASLPRGRMITVVPIGGKSLMRIIHRPIKGRVAFPRNPPRPPAAVEQEQKRQIVFGFTGRTSCRSCDLIMQCLSLVFKSRGIWPVQHSRLQPRESCPCRGKCNERSVHEAYNPANRSG